MVSLRILGVALVITGTLTVLASHHMVFEEGWSVGEAAWLVLSGLVICVAGVGALTADEPPSP